MFLILTVTRKVRLECYEATPLRFALYSRYWVDTVSIHPYRTDLKLGDDASAVRSYGSNSGPGNVFSRFFPLSRVRRTGPFTCAGARVGLIFFAAEIRNCIGRADPVLDDSKPPLAALKWRKLRCLILLVKAIRVRVRSLANSLVVRSVRMNAS
jgi:hypothetical protein